MTMQTVMEVLPVAPPATAVGMILLGYPLADWAVVATLTYTILMSLVILPKVVAVIKNFMEHLHGTCKRSGPK